MFEVSRTKNKHIISWQWHLIDGLCLVLSSIHNSYPRYCVPFGTMPCIFYLPQRSRHNPKKMIFLEKSSVDRNLIQALPSCLMVHLSISTSLSLFYTMLTALSKWPAVKFRELLYSLHSFSNWWDLNTVWIRTSHTASSGCTTKPWTWWMVKRNLMTFWDRFYSDIWGLFWLLVLTNRGGRNIAHSWEKPFGHSGVRLATIGQEE